ncbi:MAG: putative DNA binding domain-containing protein, partial [Deltaproteobacteria bacterium]|nr:putative DNA binding domain-containing protein [Deltaproteobacteria bacterium]
MNISEILIRPEGKTLEFKRDISSLKPILKTLVAFANTAGGILIIGRGSDGTIHGVPEVLQAEERLANAIADSIRPAMMPEIEIYSHNDKPLLILRVFHWKGPFYLKADGPEKGVYVRLGSTNRQAGPEILAELQRSMQNRSYDQLPCADLSVKALDVEKVKRIFSVTGRKIDEKKLESLGLLVPYAGGLSVSNGGLILFGLDNVRKRYFPDARVSCARFRGTDKTEFIDRMDITGTVLNAFDEVPRFIRRNTRLAAKIENMHRQDIPEYPELAIREILVNAIVHADYSLRGMRILVAIYADRMEVQNPGMLPFGMTMEDFKAGVSKIRNRVIARVFREMGFMEEWGSGYKRVLHACQSGGYPEPDWQELGMAF